MTTMNLKTVEVLEAFLEGNQLAAFAVLGNKTQRYHFIRNEWGQATIIALCRLFTQ